MNNHEEMEQMEAQRMLQEYQKNKSINKNTKKQEPKSRKKAPQERNTGPKHTQEMEAQPKIYPKMKFHDLPQQIQMYLIQIYPFGNKLFLSGIMENGQTLSLVAAELYRQIYFVLKDQNGDQSQMSEIYLKKAEQQIRMRLRNVGLSQDQYIGHMVDMQYVFELKQVPRNRRKYFKVRYSFKCQLQQQIQPDWQGQTYKYIIGTSYTAMELLIINRRIKGPCWVKIQKQYLAQNVSNNVQVGLCLDLRYLESITVCERTEPPTVRVMSISVKQIIPATISKKKYFPKDKDESHIYCVSYHYCPQYKVSIKDQKPKLIHRTFYLQQLGNRPNSQFQPCPDQQILFAKFYADILKYDPDFFVCHDSTKIIDSLIWRLGRLDKNSKIKLSRLKVARDTGKSNQTHRINSFIAGRLLVDTYFHSKDMVKSIQYDLQNMAQYARPEKKFTGISDEQSKTFFNEQKPLALVNKCRQQSQLTFQIMNHFQILQTTRQLSNICGNLWKRSLQNKRAERNQFLIMHQCKNRDLIIPDKFIKNKGGDDEQTQTRKKYQGGMVLQPEKGFYSQYILLLDFNSLYPSIIREYNVCFSIIDRPKLTLDFYYKSKAKKKQLKQKKQKKQISHMMDEQNPQNQDGLQQMFQNVKSCNDKTKWGFLPMLIHDIVQQRKKCKKKMKKATNPFQILILDIQQKCYKVVANSIYGCLGFSVSRFYSMPLAALITKKGRDALLSAKDIVSKKGGVRVIYGDTDSLMIEPQNLKVDQDASQVQKLKSLKKTADELRIQINSKYTFLQIDVDGIFKPLILLMKKKYVANKLKNFEDILMGGETQPKFQLQYKGIQIVRRDGCNIARDTLKKVINIMVRTDNTELQRRYQQIIDLFTKIKSQIVNQPLQNLLFSKQLTKKPKDYVNADHLPHVKVAKDRIEAGEKDQSLVNHTIFYLICKPRDSNSGLAHNAFDLKSFKRSQQFEPENKLQIDFDYYKSIIVQPVGRLLANINDRIYDQLVSLLQISKGRAKNIRQLIGDQIQQSSSIGQSVSRNLQSKAKQFSRDLGNNMKCIKCQLQFPIINAETTALINIKCPGKDCGYSMIHVLHNKIRAKMRQQQINYYNNRKRCICSKTYQLTNIVPCCDLDKNSGHKKDQNSFRIHNFLYLVTDLLKKTIDTLHKQHNEIQKMKLQKTKQMAENFLNQSNYQIIVDGFSKIKL